MASFLDTQQTKRSPSDGHSNSNSANDSDLNLSDQSLSSLPNSKSPEFLGTKSPENPSKSAERTKSSDALNSLRTSEVKMLDPKTKAVKSPENLSSSSDSLSKSPDLQESKSDENMKTEHSSEMEDDDISKEEKSSASTKLGTSKSPDLLSVQHAIPKQSKDREKMIRKRDEKFVTAACEMDNERTSPTRRGLNSRSVSPSKSLIEAAADVASSLEGAVDAVIQSSPRAKRRQLEFEPTDHKWVMEEDFSLIRKNTTKSPEREEGVSKIFKKCELKQSLKGRHETGRKKSSEYLPSHDEPYPDFKFCKIKCHEENPRLILDRYRSDRSISIENMPLLGSYDMNGDQGDDGEFFSGTKRFAKEKNRRELDMILNMSHSVETGSSWSLGRSERFYNALKDAEREEKWKNSSTWSLNRYKSMYKADLSRHGLRRSKHDDTEEGKQSIKSSAVREDSSAANSRRSVRSHSLSLQSRQELKDLEDRLTESWGEEYRQNLANFADRLSEKLAEEIDQYREEANSKHLFSSLPSGLELKDDPYLTRLSAQLLDLNRLSAELKERNNYLASLSDEDINKEFSKFKLETNPFQSCELDNATANILTRGNPFLTDDSESERSKNEDCDVSNKRNRATFEDSFVPFEIDSPPKKEEQDEDKRLIEGTEDQPMNFERIQQEKHADTESVRSSESWKPSRDKRKNLLFVKSASLDDSYKFLGKSEKNKRAESDMTRKDTSRSTAKGENVRKKQKTAKKNQSTESADLDPSFGSRKSIRIPSWESSVDTDPGSSIQRDLSKMTIASSLGYSMESSDPEASGGTGSGSDCSRRDTCRATASTASLGWCHQYFSWS